MKIAYYITPHGFGHAIRSLEVVRHLMDSGDGLEVVLISDIPEFLVQQNLGRIPMVRKRRLDVGLVQKDSLRFDLEATFQAVNDLYRREADLVAEEVDFLRDQKVHGIVSDIPFLPFRAARECKIPSIGLSNFTWDWIYKAYSASDSRWNSIVGWIQENYRLGDVLLRLPMHGDCSAFPNIVDVPLVARKARYEVKETRKLLGCESGKKYYLISFSDLELDSAALGLLEQVEKTEFFYRHPLDFHFRNGHSLNDLNLSYSDIVAAVDGVITKPGYGIVADCVAAGTPVIYTDRGFFPEYDILVRGIRQHLRAVYMPSADLYSGRWQSAIKELESLPNLHIPLRDDGASLCAKLILKQILADRTKEV